MATKTPRAEAGQRIRITFEAALLDDGTTGELVLDGVVVERDHRHGYTKLHFDTDGERLVPTGYVDAGRVPDRRCRAHGRA